MARFIGSLYGKSVSKLDMWYILHEEGVWCRGRRARCYKGNQNACKKCKYYNKKGTADGKR